MVWKAFPRRVPSSATHLYGIVLWCSHTGLEARHASHI
jgi:hypothetical protein